MPPPSPPPSPSLPHIVDGLHVIDFNQSRSAATAAFSQILNGPESAPARYALAATVASSLIVSTVASAISSFAAGAGAASSAASATGGVVGGAAGGAAPASAVGGMSLAAAVPSLLCTQRFALMTRLGNSADDAGDADVSAWMSGSLGLTRPWLEARGASRGGDGAAAPSGAVASSDESRRRMQEYTYPAPPPPPPAPPPTAAALRRAARSARILARTVDIFVSLLAVLSFVTLAELCLVVYYRDRANKAWYDLRRRGGLGSGGGRILSVVPNSPKHLPGTKAQLTFRSLPTAALWPHQHVAVIVAFTAGLVEGACALIGAWVSNDTTDDAMAFACSLLALLIAFYARELRGLLHFAKMHAPHAWVPAVQPSHPSEVTDPALAVLNALLRMLCLPALQRDRTQGELVTPSDAGSAEPRRTEEAIKAWLSGGCLVPHIPFCERLAADLRSDFGRLRKVKRTAFSGARQRREAAARAAARASTSLALERQHVWLRDASGASRLGCTFHYVHALLAFLISASVGFLTTHPLGEGDYGPHIKLSVLMVLLVVGVVFSCAGTANNLWRGVCASAVYFLECAAAGARVSVTVLNWLPLPLASLLLL